MLPDVEANLGRMTVDLAFDGKDRIDPGNRLQRHRRYRIGWFTLASGGGNIGELEELAPRMAPAEGTGHRRRFAAVPVEVIVAAITAC